MFDGVERPNHNIKQFLLRSFYERMTTLGSITSLPYLDFINLLNPALKIL